MTNRWRSAIFKRAFVKVQQGVETALEQPIEPAMLLCVLGSVSRRAHIIGVSVSEITSDKTSETLTATANSRNILPTYPPMKNSGMNTAISDSVIETMVKPISREPFSAASIGLRPSSRWRTMFSITTTASSTTKPTAIVKRHQRQVVEAVAEFVERGEGADQRQRHGDRRE